MSSCKRKRQDSVRVTLDLPSEAVERLLEIAKAQNELVGQLGISSLQIQGEKAMSFENAFSPPASPKRPQAATSSSTSPLLVNLLKKDSAPNVDTSSLGGEKEKKVPKLELQAQQFKKFNSGGVGGLNKLSWSQHEHILMQQQSVKRDSGETAAEKSVRLKLKLPIEKQQQQQQQHLVHHQLQLESSENSVKSNRKIPKLILSVKDRTIIKKESDKTKVTFNHNTSTSSTSTSQNCLIGESTSSDLANGGADGTSPPSKTEVSTNSSTNGDSSKVPSSSTTSSNSKESASAASKTTTATATNGFEEQPRPDRHGSQGTNVEDEQYEMAVDEAVSALLDTPSEEESPENGKNESHAGEDVADTDLALRGKPKKSTTGVGLLEVEKFSTTTKQSKEKRISTRSTKVADDALKRRKLQP